MASAKLDYTAAVEAQGFAVLEAVLGQEEVAALRDEFERLSEAPHARKRGTSLFAARDVLRSSVAIRSLAMASPLVALVQRMLGENARPVKALLFDKTPRANWKVAWHQDKTIAVRERKAVAHYGPWSVKAGIVHVQPPAAVLEGMLTVRVHLDDCGAENGALRVIPGSHRQGKLSHEAIQEVLRHTAAATCVVSSGGVLLMRPLLLHSSSPATRPRHRRVIHLDYAARALPTGLAWYAGGEALNA